MGALGALFHSNTGGILLPSPASSGLDGQGEGLDLLDLWVLLSLLRIRVYQTTHLPVPGQLFSPYRSQGINPEKKGRVSTDRSAEEQQEQYCSHDINLTERKFRVEKLTPRGI